MAKIFISYRRDDSSGYAQTIYRELVQHFSKDQVFIDVDTLEPGVDFVRVIEEAVAECDVLLALIGKRWANVRTGAKSRLDDPNDFVRLEISAALARDIRVIPVLVDAVRMPAEKILPTSLKALTRRNALEISHTRFNYDVEQLISAVRRVFDATEVKRKAEEDRKRVEEERSRTEQEAEQRRLQAEAQRRAEEERAREEDRIRPGAVFRDKLKDGSEGPEMVVVLGGTFKMGDIQGTDSDYEKPVHNVSIAKPFAIARHQATFEDYDRFASATGRESIDDKGWGRGHQPVINVSWQDAVEYAKWLSAQTGKLYRLPTEAEWEYAARAGTDTIFWWGNEVNPGIANFAGSDNYWGGKQTAPVGSFKPNPFGLYDTAGNVWEWVEDCWHENYEGAPTDGSAGGKENGDDYAPRVLRGGSWNFEARLSRSSYRRKSVPQHRSSCFGFRLVRHFD